MSDDQFNILSSFLEEARKDRKDLFEKVNKLTTDVAVLNTEFKTASGEISEAKKNIDSIFDHVHGCEDSPGFLTRLVTIERMFGHYTKGLIAIIGILLTSLSEKVMGFFHVTIK